MTGESLAPPMTLPPSMAKVSQSQVSPRGRNTRQADGHQRSHAGQSRQAIDLQRAEGRQAGQRRGEKPATQVNQVEGRRNADGGHYQSFDQRARQLQTTMISCSFDFTS